MRMKLEILCAALGLVLLGCAEGAEPTQPSPGSDPSPSEIRLEERDQPLTEGIEWLPSPGNSSNSSSYTRSGWTRYRSKQYREALGDFQKAVSLNSTNASAWPNTDKPPIPSGGLGCSGPARKDITGSALRC
jgi:hypothetical protein